MEKRHDAGGNQGDDAGGSGWLRDATPLQYEPRWPLESHTLLLRVVVSPNSALCSIERLSVPLIPAAIENSKLLCQLIKKLIRTSVNKATSIQT